MPHVTGTFLRPDGNPFANQTIAISRVPDAVVAQEGGVLVPEVQSFTTDVLGQVNFIILAGKYKGEVTLSTGPKPFVMNVPEDSTVDIMDCVESAGIPLTPASTAAAQAARDAAIAAQVAAETAVAGIMFQTVASRAAAVTWAAAHVLTAGFVL